MDWPKRGTKARFGCAFVGETIRNRSLFVGSPLRQTHMDLAGGSWKTKLRFAGCSPAEHEPHVSSSCHGHGQATQLLCRAHLPNVLGFTRNIGLTFCFICLYYRRTFRGDPGHGTHRLALTRGRPSRESETQTSGFQAKQNLQPPHGDNAIG